MIPSAVRFPNNAAPKAVFHRHARRALWHAPSTRPENMSGAYRLIYLTCRSRGAWYCHSVKPLSFEELARLPVIEFYEAAFRKATGVSLKVVPPGETAVRLSYGKDENPLCTLLAGTPNGCGACLETQRRAQRAAAKRAAPHQINCLSGMTDVAVPVLAGGKHVATLMSGQVFRREPTERDFKMIAAMVGGRPNADWEKRLRKAYFETPVVTSEQFEATIQLLNVFAQYLAEHASRQALAGTSQEPAAVASAKQFVQTHAEEPITLERVVRHVNVSRFYFCKLFKKATGMTLTEYVSRVRIEKAKTLLVDPTLRVSEVVYAAGFGSIPRFNSVFKRYVGMPPTEYRATLRSQLPA
jgi:AraC-like DNA-binding protein/ligand-binding sensor protein